MLCHQYIANFFAGQSQAHQTAQKIAVGQRVRLIKAAAQEPDGILRLLLPVGQKMQLAALGAVIAAPKQVPGGHTHGMQQPLGQRLLLRGQKTRHRRHIAALALLPFIPNAACQQPLIL